MTTIILSDLHLGALNSRTDQLAEILRGNFERLILNGDTVNSLNFEKFRRSDWRIIDLLQGISRERELVLIRGNHDGQPGEREEFGSLDLLADLLDSEMHEEYQLSVAGGRYLVLHGDQFDNTLNMSWIGNVADWWYNQIQRISKPMARWCKSRVKHWGAVISCVRAGAVPLAKQRGCTGVITGHTHFCDDRTLDGIHYLNTGCWTDSPCTYVRVEDGQARLVRWSEERVTSPSYAMELSAAQ